MSKFRIALASALATLVFVTPAGAQVYNWGFVKGGWINASTPQPMGIEGKLDASNASDYVLDEGAVWAWGDNENGELGHAGGSSTTPVAVELPVKAVAIGEARQDGMAIDAEGEAYAWGADGNGVLCASTNPTPRVPKHVILPEKVVAVQGGETHSMWLTEAGTVLSCGDNEVGQLGVGSSVKESPKPLAVSLPGKVVEMSAGEKQELVRLENGKVYGWGGNSHGQTCTGSSESRVYTPQEVPLPEPAKQVSAGGDLPDNGSSLITLQNGDVYGCGFNTVGTADPLSSTKKLSTPTFTGVTEAVEAVTGGETSYARLSSGDLVAWGGTEFGDIGNGSTGPGEVRVPLVVQEGVSEVSATAWTVLSR